MLEMTTPSSPTLTTPTTATTATTTTTTLTTPATTTTTSDPGQDMVTVWVDGCFDLMHYGHANALRQARAMGDRLVVGVHSDADIQQHKGPTVLREEERYLSVAACKWVDQVVPNAPYFTTLDTLNQFKCTFCVHGDDVTTLADGTDCYRDVKLANRYKECQRTVGVSTTELVGRMLLMNRQVGGCVAGTDSDRDPEKRAKVDTTSAVSSPTFLLASHFLTPPTTTPPSSSSSSPPPHPLLASSSFPMADRIAAFSDGRRPLPGDKVVYLAGDFDLFHLGHIETLKQAKQLGDFLLVGIHDDNTVLQTQGAPYPLMQLHERVLSVLACRYVDDVVIGAPRHVTHALLTQLYKVDVVAIAHPHGTTLASSSSGGASNDDADKEAYVVPDTMGITVRLPEHPWSAFSASEIVWRIIEQRKLYV